MRLYWLTFENRGEIAVVIEPAHSLIHARMACLVRTSGKIGEFREGHQLDKQTAGKVPKTLIGQVLSRTQAEKLIVKLA